MSVQLKHTLMLLLGAFIWGMAFVAQSVGGNMGAMAFLAYRGWFAVVVLGILVAVFSAMRRKNGEWDGKPRTPQEKKTLLVGGTVTGIFLWAASYAQQNALTIDPSTAKAGFLTAIYVIIVPVIGLILGRRCGKFVWFGILLSVVGLYLLCMKNGFGKLSVSDCWLIACAFLFAFQILSVDHFAPLVDGIRLSLMEFIVETILATIAAVIMGELHPAEILTNFIPIFYCGVFSSGVAYTLQILGQRDVDPAIACIAMCMESVFSAIGGWLLLGQKLAARELIGCILMFAAILLAQLPDKKAQKE